MTSFVGAVALFALGCAIAAVLPRPLEEDKRVWKKSKNPKSPSRVGRRR